MVAEVGIIDQSGQGVGGISRATGCQGFDGIEELEATDQVQGHAGDDGWVEQGQCHVGELLEFRCPVDIRSFVESFGNSLDTCQVDDHGDTAILKGVYDYNDPNGSVTAGKPVQLIHAQHDQNIVQGTVIVLEEEVIHVPHDDRCDQNGQIYDDTA